MEDAKITRDNPQQPQQTQQPQMYQQGKYPSIIDTDDLVFKIGLETVGNLNREKLLDNFVEKIGAMEKALSEAIGGKKIAEDKMVQFQKSNDLYTVNNRELDVALTSERNQLSSLKAKLLSFEASDKSQKAEIERLEKEYEELIEEFDLLRKDRNAMEEKYTAEIEKLKARLSKPKKVKKSKK